MSENKGSGFPFGMRPWKFGVLLIVLFFLVLGMVQCGDSSWWTFHAEEFNRKFILPAFIVVVVGGLAAWFIVKKKRKDL